MSLDATSCGLSSAQPARSGANCGACEDAACGRCSFARTAVGTAPRWLCRREAAARCVKRHSGGRRSLELGWTTSQSDAAGLAAASADETAIAATNADEATRASAGTAWESLDAAIGHGQRVSTSSICRTGSCARAGGPLGCRAAASTTSHMSQPPRGPQPSLVQRQGRRASPDSAGISHAFCWARPNLSLIHI